MSASCGSAPEPEMTLAFRIARSITSTPEERERLVVVWARSSHENRLVADSAITAYTASFLRILQSGQGVLMDPWAQILGSSPGRTRLIAILRGLNAGAASHFSTTLVSLGVRCVEITVQDETGLRALAATVGVADDSNGLVGAGSVTSVERARQAADAGARFLVSPGFSEDVVGFAHRQGLPVLPGVATPTEIQRAQALGVETVKLFPAQQLGGVEYLRALRGPFPKMQFVPTGGIGFDNASQYLAAGALAVGLGGQLTGPGGLGRLNAWLDRMEAAAHE